MKISVVIPAYNEEKYISECLKSIEQYGRELFEVIVVDNNSTDRTVEIAKTFKNVKVITESRRGVTFARNRGIQESSGDIITFIDADNRIHDNWIPKIKKEFHKDKNLVSLSGPYKYYDLCTTGRIMTDIGLWFYPIVNLVVGYLAIAGNLAVRREPLIKVNGFDTNIAFYGDDADIIRRLHKYGKVKFTMDFFIYSSGRRLANGGIIKIFAIYIINYFWVVFFKKPLTKSYNNIR